MHALQSFDNLVVRQPLMNKRDLPFAVAIFLTNLWFIGCVGTVQDSAPKNVAQDEKFLHCMDEGNCGLENKCSFTLHGTKTEPAHNKNNTDSMVNNPVTVSGHLVAIKNHMPYSVIFFWDILGFVPPEGHDPNEKYNAVLCHPNTITYVDTKISGPHRVHLSVSTIGNDPSLLNGYPNPEYLEPIQTLIASGDECTKYQTCRLLDNVCYMASRGNLDCEGYKYVCNNFDDGDQVARDACIPECLYTYWPMRMEDFKEIDSEQVVDWISRGGGVKGSSVNGLCKTEVVVGLSISLMLSLLVNMAFVCIGCKYRRSIKNMDLKTYKEGEADDDEFSLGSSSDGDNKGNGYF